MVDEQRNNTPGAPPRRKKRGRPRKHEPRAAAAAALVPPKNGGPAVGSVIGRIPLRIAEGPITANGVLLNPPSELPRDRDVRCAALSSTSSQHSAEARRALKMWKFDMIAGLFRQYPADDRDAATKVASRFASSGVKVTAAYVRAVRRALKR